MFQKILDYLKFLFSGKGEKIFEEEITDPAEKERLKKEFDQKYLDAGYTMERIGDTTVFTKPNYRIEQTGFSFITRIKNSQNIKSEDKEKLIATYNKIQEERKSEISQKVTPPRYDKEALEAFEKLDSYEYWRDS